MGTLLSQKAWVDGCSHVDVAKELLCAVSPVDCLRSVRMWVVLCRGVLPCQRGEFLLLDLDKEA